MSSNHIGLNGTDDIDSHMRGMSLNPSSTSNPNPGSHEAVISQSPRTGRKRPNQAQRRNLSSQLVIPINPRPWNMPSITQSQEGWGQQRGHQSRNRAPTRFQHNHAGYNHHIPVHQNQWNISHIHQNNGREHKIGPTGYPNHRDNHFSGHQNQGHHSRSSSLSTYSRRDQGSGNYHHDQKNGQFHNTHNSDPLNLSHGSFQPSGKITYSTPRNAASSAQLAAAYLDNMSQEILRDSEIEPSDLSVKENLRQRLELICRKAVTAFETAHYQDFPPSSVELRCFGSVASGFATRGSDMDLGLVTPLSVPQPTDVGSPIPRIIEKAFLDHGFGARLLTRTRVPIIKLCEKPTAELMAELLKEREKWEMVIDSDEKKSDTPNGELNQPTTSTANDMVNDAIEHEIEDTITGHIPHDSSLIVDGKIHLFQQGNQSINCYYTITRKLMVQLGVSDLEKLAENCDATAVVTLGRICYAFIQGLSDDKLRERLLLRPYCTFSECEQSLDLTLVEQTSVPSIPHSIGVIYYLAEAEEHLIRWENRPVGLFGEDIEASSITMATEMQELLQQEAFTEDEALTFGHGVFSLLSRFKQLSVVQVVMMEQRPNESSTDYYNRANRLFRILCSSNRSGSSRDSVSLFLYHFINGVHNPDVRAIVAQFYNERMYDPYTCPTLADLSLRHKSLQLAVDFEIALTKPSYEEKDRPWIQQYINILRHSLVKLNTAGPRAWYKYCLQTSISEKPIIDYIKTLSDPSLYNQTKEKYRDELEFPKDGVGAQCDINFSAHLALQNSLLLRCYSHTDPRVRQMVLFIKRWAKLRQINTPYRGSLSSYGYVLMVLHYLVNVVEPFVCPNLQNMAPPADSYPPEVYNDQVMCNGWDVRFMRDEEALKKACQEKTINTNKDSLGHLLAGFFEYYAQSGNLASIPGKRGFDWGREVLSLRTYPGGTLTKQEKGWISARTILVRDNASKRTTGPQTVSPGPEAKATDGALSRSAPDKKVSNPTPVESQDVTLKEVRCRYLFAIEDPFETDHNVARTVTHHGISSIRDEFRRAWKLIQTMRNGGTPEEYLMEAVSLESQQDKSFLALLESIHAHSPTQYDNKTR